MGFIDSLWKFGKACFELGKIYEKTGLPLDDFAVYALIRQYGECGLDGPDARKVLEDYIDTSVTKRFLMEKGEFLENYKLRIKPELDRR